MDMVEYGDEIGNESVDVDDEEEDDVDRCVKRRKLLAEVLAIIGYCVTLWLGSLIVTYAGIGQTYAYFIGALFGVIALFVAGIIHGEIYNEFESTIICTTRLFRGRRKDEDEGDMDE